MSRLSTLLVPGLRVRSEVARTVDKILAKVGRHRRFYSSKRQDRWVIQHVFRGARNGYFVEVGAGDGRTHSNTFALERDYGWSGIVVEANPKLASKLRQHRKCISMSACIDGTCGEDEFFCFGHLGGIVGYDTDNSRAKRGFLLRMRAANILAVPARPLHEVLISAGAPQKIDYLSIDVEGAEHRILRGFPFDLFAFEAMTIERPTQEVHAVLTGAGYVLERVYRNDGFYLSPERAAQLGSRGISFGGTPEKPF